jgi:hypothetical protein
MRYRLVSIAIIVATVLLSVSTFLSPAISSAADCHFTLGFKTLHDLIPWTVGDCQVDERHGANGDALQETAGRSGKGGLLVWRKADNWTAYTDGATTWINGPNGIQSRPNNQRYPWEANPDGLPIAVDPVSTLLVNIVGSWTVHGVCDGDGGGYLTSRKVFHPDGTLDDPYELPIGIKPEMYINHWSVRRPGVIGMVNYAQGFEYSVTGTSQRMTLTEVDLHLGSCTYDRVA